MPEKFGVWKAALIAGALAGAPDLAEARPRKPASEVRPRVPQIKEWSLDDPEFSRPFPHGELSQKERLKRTETLKHGEIILHDVGLTFYRVAEGDTRTRIIQKLNRYPKYRYLQTQTQKIKSFNIPDSELQVGMWIPIPLPEYKRELSDQAFAKFADQAVSALQVHPHYAQTVRAIIQKTGRRELVAGMLAVAKQESGGLPIGQFELHRWEPRHNTFSFSLFHVLMTGPGLTARQKLNMTEGQLYHPRNAAQLFLAFLAEKCADSKREPQDFFPLAGNNLVPFAEFYNGSAWKTFNPGYVKHLQRYHDEAWNLLHPPKPKKPHHRRHPRHHR
ncbi:hypothetical protein EXS71_04445 [Candidatus Uhrbacteria bacterium]|nr:hypothetical protein [Candidatus Uhrbacteria bacterium]